MLVAAYVKELQRHYGDLSVRQHLAAIRGLFDDLVTGGVLRVNSAASVKGAKVVIRKGKTPVLSASEAQRLLDSIDATTIVRRTVRRTGFLRGGVASVGFHRGERHVEKLWGFGAAVAGCGRGVRRGRAPCRAEYPTEATAVCAADSASRCRTDHRSGDHRGQLSDGACRPLAGR